MNEHNRGNSELLECVLIAKQIETMEISWQIGCAEIARRTLAGRVSPNEICTLLSEISVSLDSPDDLSIFELIAHEQYGHEGLGITAASCIPDIMSECERLASHGV